MCSLTRVGQVKATARRGAEMEWSWLTPASCTRFSPPPSTRGRAQPLFPFALGCGDVADPSSGLLHRHQWRHLTLLLSYWWLLLILCWTPQPSYTVPLLFPPGRLLQFGGFIYCLRVLGLPNQVPLTG